MLNVIVPHKNEYQMPFISFLLKSVSRFHSKKSHGYLTKRNIPFLRKNKKLNKTPINLFVRYRRSFNLRKERYLKIMLRDI